MDFALTETQQTLADLAAQIFTGERDPWTELAKAHLLGIGLPNDVGGTGLGFLEVCILLEQQGRRVVPVPLLSTLVGAAAINEFGSAEQRKAVLEAVCTGDAVVACAFEPVVAYAEQSQWIVAPADGGALRLIDTAANGVGIEPVETTDGQPHALVHIDHGAGSGEPLGGPGAAQWLSQRLTIGRCATQVGVCEEAVTVAATYTSNRMQFGRPLSTFQGVAMRAADASIDTEAMRVSMWQAAWLLSEGREATTEVEVAAWWAAEAGYRVVHATQHLHGGMGADVSYPIHRYFLWGKQLVQDLGGAGRRLSALGDALAGVQ